MELGRNQRLWRSRKMWQLLGCQLRESLKVLHMLFMLLWVSISSASVIICSQFIWSGLNFSLHLNSHLFQGLLLGPNTPQSYTHRCHWILWYHFICSHLWVCSSGHAYVFRVNIQIDPVLRKKISTLMFDGQEPFDLLIKAPREIVFLTFHIYRDFEVSEKQGYL